MVSSIVTKCNLYIDSRYQNFIKIVWNIQRNIKTTTFSTENLWLRFNDILAVFTEFTFQYKVPKEINFGFKSFCLHYFMGFFFLVNDMLISSVAVSLR